MRKAPVFLEESLNLFLFPWRHQLEIQQHPSSSTFIRGHLPTRKGLWTHERVVTIIHINGTQVLQMVVGIGQATHRRGTGTTFHNTRVGVPNAPLGSLDCTEGASAHAGAVVALEALQGAHGRCTDDSPVGGSIHTIHPVEGALHASIRSGAHLSFKGVRFGEVATSPVFVERCLGQWVYLLRHDAEAIIYAAGTAWPIRQAQGAEGHRVVVMMGPIASFVIRARA